MSTIRSWPALVLLSLPVLAGVHCGEALDERPCPESGTDLTYEGFGRAFVAAYCNECHAAAVDDRQGAPPSFVFDTRDQIVDHADRIFVRSAGDNASMPPGPDDPPEDEREQLAEWLSCGAP
jgi:uncharacterized membrane protein